MRENYSRQTEQALRGYLPKSLWGSKSDARCHVSSARLIIGAVAHEKLSKRPLHSGIQPTLGDVASPHIAESLRNVLIPDH